MPCVQGHPQPYPQGSTGVMGWEHQGVVKGKWHRDSRKVSLSDKGQPVHWKESSVFPWCGNIGYSLTQKWAWVLCEGCVLWKILTNQTNDFYWNFSFWWDSCVSTDSSSFLGFVCLDLTFTYWTNKWNPQFLRPSVPYRGQGFKKEREYKDYSSYIQAAAAAKSWSCPDS